MKYTNNSYTGWNIWIIPIQGEIYKLLIYRVSLIHDFTPNHREYGRISPESRRRRYNVIFEIGGGNKINRCICSDSVVTTVLETNWTLPNNSIFLTPLSLQPDDEDLWYFKLTLYDLTAFIVWNNKGLRHHKLQRYWN